MLSLQSDWRDDLHARAVPRIRHIPTKPARFYLTDETAWALALSDIFFAAVPVGWRCGQRLCIWMLLPARAVRSRDLDKLARLCRQRAAGQRSAGGISALLAA